MGKTRTNGKLGTALASPAAAPAITISPEQLQQMIASSVSAALAAAAPAPAEVTEQQAAANRAAAEQQTDKQTTAVVNGKPVTIALHGKLAALAAERRAALLASGTAASLTNKRNYRKDSDNSVSLDSVISETVKGETDSKGNPLLAYNPETGESAQQFRTIKRKHSDDTAALLEYEFAHGCASDIHVGILTGEQIRALESLGMPVNASQVEYHLGKDSQNVGCKFDAKQTRLNVASKLDDDSILEFGINFNQSSAHYSMIHLGVKQVKISKAK